MSLSRRLAMLVSLALAGVWLLAVLAMAAILHGERDELYDQQLQVSATAFLPVLSRAWEAGMTEAPGYGVVPPGPGPEEALLYRLLDAQGGVLIASPGAEALPPMAPGRIERTATHVVYTTPVSPRGFAMQFADPLAERREAYRESLTSFLLPMLAVLPAGFLLAGWAARVGLRPLETLRCAIAARDSRSLDPIDPAGAPAELTAIVATLNGFIARLDQALEGERAFATNAAHELRNPVAVALAQIQRLRQENADPAAVPRIAAVETALKRMSRLVTRLLQLARADAGIGAAAEPVDAARILSLIAPEEVRLTLPGGPVPVRMDADALAIVAGNLIDNALQHGSGGGVEANLSEDGQLRIRNACAVIPAEALMTLTTRFRRGGGAGFGLGLHIADQILRQAGGRLELASPVPGRMEGFEARAILPR